MNREEIIIELRSRLRRDTNHILWAVLTCYEDNVAVNAENIARYIYKPVDFVRGYKELWMPYRNPSL